MFTVTKNDQIMQLHDKVQLAAFKKSGWVEAGADTIGRYEQPYQTLPAADQYAPSPTPTTYTQEQLEQIAQTETGRKDLLTIADSLAIEYPPNIPTARLIEQILAHQNPAR